MIEGAMTMKALLLTSAACTLMGLAACGGPQVEIKGDNGETVKVNAKGDMSVTDKDGKTASVTNDNGKVTVKDDKGTTTMESKDGGVTVKSAEGGMEMGKDKITEAELGLPFYPGSTSVNDQKVDSGGKTSLICIRETKDDPAKVGAFYKDKFTVESNASANQGGTDTVAMSGKLKDGRKVAVQVNKSGDSPTSVSVVVAKE